MGNKVIFYKKEVNKIRLLVDIREDCKKDSKDKGELKREVHRSGRSSLIETNVHLFYIMTDVKIIKDYVSDHDDGVSRHGLFYLHD